ncbi:MAG TPA: SpoIIE family protein phosphatase [Clostridia bacterium]|nr:SpoIIE family protein phosphatase [Clostridia bacterium]
MNDLCTDIGYMNVNKYGEQLCGDHVEVVHQDENALVSVLADGLGSGVKASILSTLTAKLISTMVANSLTLEECVEAMATTLPICKTRGVAYSTFTILRITDKMEAELIQYDNPHVILLRGGKSLFYPEITETIGDKTIHKSKIQLREGDVFVMLSDGVVHAGVGLSLNFGWTRKEIAQYLEAVYDARLTAKSFSTMLLDRCCSLYEGKPGDDATVCAVKIRRRTPMNLLIGPPSNPADVSRMMALFFSKEGKHIVCGGTTSMLAADYLNKPLVTSLPSYIDPDIPPTAAIEGVDVATEGVITLNRVLDYARDYAGENTRYGAWCCSEDGASKIARLLFEEATDIGFFVGRAVNPAHQSPNLPITFSIKMNLVEELAQCLRGMGKKVKISYF